jgi:colanic acid/amylovoran biosynthesis glycosyltransferase
VTYPGFISDQQELLNHRPAHATLFTHITQDSPRNHFEALISGTPILGYHSSYAAELINSCSLVPLGDFRSLGKLVADLSKDRDKLVELSGQAALNGRRFNDSAVFAERSRLIQEHA